MPSHYVEFLNEYTGASVSEYPWGFFVYRVERMGEHQCLYIEEVFLAHEHRNIKGRKQLLTAIAETCKIEKTDVIMASVDVTHKNSTNLLKIYLWNGFSVLGERGVKQDQLLFLYKKFQLEE